MFLVSTPPTAPAAPSRGAAGHPARRERGFTLVELMVVIVILGGLIALVGPRVFQALGKAGVGTAEAQMANFQQTVSMYYAEHRKLPQSLEVLTEEDPKTGEPWLDSVPKDPWGNAYDYRIIGSKKFTIRSYGEDGQEGTADDLTWPKEGAQDE